MPYGVEGDDALGWFLNAYPITATDAGHRSMAARPRPPRSRTMTSIDRLGSEVARTVRDVLGRWAPQLLQALEDTDDPPMALRKQVEDLLATEFVSKEGLQPDHEPTPYGERVDEAIGAFVMRFPIVRSQGDP